MLALAVGAAAFNVPSPRAVATSPRSSAPVAAIEALDAITPDTYAAIAGGVAVLGGGAFAFQKQSEAVEAMRANSPSVLGKKGKVAPTKAAAKPKAAPAKKPVNPKAWPSLGGSGASHPMAGPWPKAPVREVWDPPPGWKPPTKPVQSWYDNGKRLMPPAPPAPPPAPPAPKKSFMESFMEMFNPSAGPATPKSTWGIGGGVNKNHQFSGPWPKAAPREWIDERPSKKPTPEGVTSWYDAGKRL